MVACHQFVPALEPGAVGSHTLEVQRTLHSVGIASTVFAEFTDPAMVGRARPYTDYGTTVIAQPDDCLMYHFAIGSVVASFLQDRPERKAVYHHNITPSDMIAGWEPNLVPGLRWGRRQLLALAPVSDFALADSEFNRNDLASAGYQDVEVVPILLDLNAFDHNVDQATFDRLRAERASGGTDLLFVGRVVPNKCQHDLIKALVAYRNAFDPKARLRIVGSVSSSRYADTLRAYALELGVAEAVDFAGGVSDAALAAYYQSADVFVSASEHEGFCVPLLEAMHHDVPIVAYSAAAVPETLADAGILLDTKAPALFAAAIDRVVRDDTLRRMCTDAGRRRLADFAIDVTRDRLLAALRAHGIEASR